MAKTLPETSAGDPVDVGRVQLLTEGQRRLFL